MYKFGKVDPVKEQDRKKIVEDAKIALDQTIIAAQKCLQTEQFLKYKLEYEYMEQAVINKMMLIDRMETDPVKYGFQMKECVSDIRHLRSLLQGVKADATQSST